MGQDPRVEENRQAILNSPSHRLAEYDFEFIKRDENRPLRMQLELLKTETLLRENKIESTIVVFGGTQIDPKAEAEKRLAQVEAYLLKHPEDPYAARAVERAKSILAKHHYYEASRQFSKLVSSKWQPAGKCNFVIITGGGPGIME